MITPDPRLRCSKRRVRSREPKKWRNKVSSNMEPKGFNSCSTMRAVWMLTTAGATLCTVRTTGVMRMPLSEA
jgi:hypothetical protein